MYTTTRRQWLLRGVAGLGLAAPIALMRPFPALPVHAEPATDPNPIDEAVTVTAVDADAQGVRGRIVNHSPDTLRDLELAIADRFEPDKSPPARGEDPSRTMIARVAGPVAPGQSMPFELQRPEPLPRRLDGSFTTTVRVNAMTRQPPAPQPPNVR